MRYIKPLNENKPKGAPEFHHSDAPDAEGRFKDLGIKDLAAWLIKTRKKDVKKISGSLTQQIVFNRGDDPKYAEKMEKVRKEVYKQLGREDLLEESVNEGKMPKKYIGNDEIVFLKTKEDSRGAHYNLYYKGHDIDFGGRMFGSEKQLKDFADNYILSNQWYKKLRYEDSIPLPESVDTDDLENAKERLSNPHTILDITYDKTRQGDKFVRFDYENKYVPGKMLDSGPHFVNVRYGNAKDLKKISKELNMDLKESVLNEEDTWNDYPAAAKKNAQKAIDWKEKYGRDEVDAGTPVGWARAHQLAKGENLSTDTVKRMSAFNRHRKNSSIKPELKETPWKDRGYVAWLIWGGDEGVDWAIEKSKEIDAMKESKQMKHIKQLNEAEKYITDEFKVGDKIKTDFGEWEVIETDYAPGKSFMAPFIFKGKDMERVNIPNPPRTNKKAVGYKVTDGDKYPIIGFLYQYKDITKLATVGVDESVVAEGIYAKKSKIVPGEYIKTQYGYFYKRVEGTVGGEDAYVEIKKGKEGKKKTGIHDTVDFEIVDKSIALSESVEFKYIKPLNEFNQVNESLSSYEYDKWVKENGKIKFPKWIKVKSKEIIDGGFMDKVYKSEHNYMSIWLGSFDNKTRSELYAYDDKGKKEFGEMGYKFIQSFWNDITGYGMFFWQGAMYALEVSKHIRDMEANGEAIEPAYYLMKEYFNNFGMETNRSRVFNAAVEKLEKWMEDNQIKTL